MSNSFWRDHVVMFTRKAVFVVQQAADDPIAPAEAIPYDQIRQSEHCILAVTPYGEPHRLKAIPKVTRKWYSCDTATNCLRCSHECSWHILCPRSRVVNCFPLHPSSAVFTNVSIRAYVFLNTP